MQSVVTMQLPGSWTSLTKSNNVPVKRRGGFTIASIIGDDFGTDIKSGSSSQNKERQDLIDDDPVPTATTTPSRQTELTLSVGCSRVPPPHFCLPATRRPSTVLSPLFTSRRSGEVGKLAEQDVFAMRSLMGLPVASGYFHSAVQSSIRSTTSYHLPRALCSPLPNQCGLPLPYGLLGGGTGISDGLQLYPWLLTHQGHFGYTFPGTCRLYGCFCTVSCTSACLFVRSFASVCSHSVCSHGVCSHSVLPFVVRHNETRVIVSFISNTSS